ncbi:unnamed protein product [Peronospora farinosa]|uniref:Uncharacterized protein n=1 Tax=Peronospora farinosa TaxID=134698 RepID=A0AAV0TL20_9STRA|nr:unnamed protein product [Peronospora farinosa]
MVGKSSHGDTAAGGGRGHDYIEESMNSRTSGGGGNNSSSTGNTLQPIFDKATRRVSKWISSSFSARKDDVMKVLSIDLPFLFYERCKSALMEAGYDDIDTFSRLHQR